MNEIFFALRMIAVSLTVVVLMQIRVGDTSVENHVHSWIQTAGPVLILREVAEGGVAVLYKGWSQITSNLKSKYSDKFDPENLPGKRHLQLGIQRSQEYLEDQKEKREKLEAEMADRARKVRVAVGLEDDGSLEEKTKK